MGIGTLGRIAQNTHDLHIRPAILQDVRYAGLMHVEIVWRDVADNLLSRIIGKKALVLFERDRDVVHIVVRQPLAGQFREKSPFLAHGGQQDIRMSLEIMMQGCGRALCGPHA